MRSQEGFTLLEAMMAGSLSAVLGGSILTVLYLCNDKMDESLAKARLASQYEVAAETIHRMAREAYTIVGNTEDFHDHPNPPAFTNHGWINFYRRDGTLIGGFGVNHTDRYLRESVGGEFRKFYIAGDSLNVTDYHFGITEGRKAVTFRMSLRMTRDGKTYTLTNPGEVALCRNNLP